MNLSLYGVYGWSPSLDGMRLSYGSSGNQWDEKDFALAKRLLKEGPSASKFLRMIQAWMRIKAPRYWWQQFDTYRIGVERLSGSTMHTILKRPLSQEDFASSIPSAFLSYLNELIKLKSFNRLKNLLPEGFLQERVVMASYAALLHIHEDRKNHRLEEWEEFCSWIYSNLPHFHNFLDL
jgi:hypothetical protein